MSRQQRTVLALLLISQIALAGCRPIQPRYLHSDGDLSHYLDSATDLEYPDVEQEQLPDAAFSNAPLTISDPDFSNFWDVTLEEAVSIALQNSKVIRTTSNSLATNPSAARVPDGLQRSAETAPTVYDPAVFESSPQGVEAALSEFDAQIVGGMNGLGGAPIGRRNGVNQIVGGVVTHIPQNLNPAFAGLFGTQVLDQQQLNFNAEISKKTATGATFAIREISLYNSTNSRGVGVPSTWTSQLQVDAHLPLLRGRGTLINRIPTVIARTNTDIALADFEANVRNLVSDIENQYWNLHCSYRFLALQKKARDNALATWRIVETDTRRQAHEKARSRQQYFQFRAQVESALNDLQRNEHVLRYLMGLAVADGRVLRPIDDPTTARVDFDWTTVNAEALMRTPEVREQKWRIKQAELNLIAARNNLLPELNAYAQYEAFGLGDELIRASGSDRFPATGSTAVDEMLSGDYQNVRFGFEFFMPVGFRAELAGVRNAQLSLARDHARLEDLELNTSHQLGQAIRDLDTNYHLLETQFNRWRAAKDEVDNLRALFEGGLGSLDILLDAQIRITLAEQAYYQSLCDYQRSIAAVHYRKGSLLEYDNVYLAEGPWPAKAMWDALGHARRRDAAKYVNYGWSRPNVISQGQTSQMQNGASGEFLEGSFETEGAYETLGTPTPMMQPQGSGRQPEVIEAPQGEPQNGSKILYQGSLPKAPVPSLKAPQRSILNSAAAAPQQSTLQLVNHYEPIADSGNHEPVANSSNRQINWPAAK
ncbi:TolC family protein [Lignipirellula cremea]|uniref:Outer membrane efflux protein n=1 Tax=Lignipirellula cremea TaxID=2528010 RepID=A0A518DNI4_9BACT|nr:TolC family protein [Lignipirellula cremea]QDU93396.1 Outer membrane efflux protein [Lignipirellula cremea]